MSAPQRRVSLRVGLPLLVLLLTALLLGTALGALSLGGRPQSSAMRQTGDLADIAGVADLGAVDEYDGPSPLTDPVPRTDWNANPPVEEWRRPVGGGFAGLATHPWARESVVTMEQRGDDEAVVCYDVGTGRERWAHKYAARFVPRRGGSPGPRAKPRIELGSNEPKRDGVFFKVYSLGATGRLCCLDLHSGNEDWSADILGGGANLPWGMASSPLVFSNRDLGPFGAIERETIEVIVVPGVQREGAKGRAVIVYDAQSGKELRAFGDRRGGYSRPVLARLGGTEQLLVLGADGLTGYDPKAGRELWHQSWPMPLDRFNTAAPLPLGAEHAFITSEDGCAMVRIRQGERPTIVWQNQLMRCKFATPDYRGGYLYGFEGGALVCLDARTGARQWKDGHYGHGQLWWLGRHLLVLAEAGDLVVVEPTPEGHKELARLPALKGSTGSPPALLRLDVYLRNDREMVAYRLPWEMPQGASIRQEPCD